MVFKSLCILVLWTKVSSALEGLRQNLSVWHIFLAANDNRYEGSWKNDKKNGPGKFYYLDRGQLYEGVWVEDIPKCGEMKDFCRETAVDPTQYAIPAVSISLDEEKNG